MPRRAGNQRRRSPRVGKRYPLNMRTTFEIRSKLESAAAASGRSLTQEAEYRIDESFRTDEIIGGKEMRDIASLMIGAFNAAGAAADSADGYVSGEGEYNWRRDQFCYLHAAMAVIEALLVATPRGPLDPDQISLEIDVLTKRLKERLTTQWESFATRKAAGREEDGAAE